MNEAELIEKIKQLYRRKQPLNINRVRESHPELLKAAYSIKPFLGWKQALEKAGLSYESIITEIEEYVECPYCGLHFKSLSNHMLSMHEVSTEDFRMEYPGVSMVAEATRLIQNPDHPVLPHWEFVWSKEYILDRSWQWYQMTGRCNLEFITSSDASLASAAGVSYFSSWDEVLKKLQLDPLEIRLGRPIEMLYPTKESLLQAIREHHTSGQPLSNRVIQREFLYLNNAARKYFGGWPAAVKAAGLEREHKKQSHLNRLTHPPMLYPNKQDVLQALRQRHEKGLSVSCGMVLKEDPELIRCFRYHFKHWEQGIKEAGLVRAHKSDLSVSWKKPKTYPTDKSIFKAIRKLYREGYSMSASKIKDSHPGLVGEAYSRFGSWPKARELAGIDVSKLDKSIQARNHEPLNKSAIIQALKERHKQNLSLLHSKVREDNPHLVHCINRHFSSWADAMKAAGLAKVQQQQVAKVRKEVGLRHRNTDYPDKESIIKALEKRVKNNESILAKVILKENSALHSKMRQQFGTVLNAIREAGLKKEHQKQHKNTHNRRIKYPAPENVLNEIRNRVARGDCILSTSVHDQDASLNEKALLWFGKWAHACREAGVEEHYQKALQKRATLRQKNSKTKKHQAR